LADILKLGGKLCRIAKLRGYLLLRKTIRHLEGKVLLILAYDIGGIGNIVLFQFIGKL
jgi:hypothetical protein